MKRKTAVFFLCAGALFLVPSGLDAYLVMYKEQYYKLFHVHYNQYPDDTMENIYWLERALKAPFTNALYAFSPVTTEIPMADRLLGLRV